MRVAVMGSGSWGTAFAQVMADASHDVSMWGRSSDTVNSINEQHRNARYLTDLVLPDQVRASTDPGEVLANAQVVVVVLPAQTLRHNLEQWGEAIPPGVPVVSLMKGLERDTLLRMSEVLHEVAGIPREWLVVVSGPNLSREIAQRQPAATVVAAADSEVARMVQEACTTRYLRPYTNHDVVGVELAGAIKNVVALATGMAQGMGFGDNSKASIITRGLAEMTRIGVALGAEPMTFAGLAGIGDLVATCMSPLSRNRSFGEYLGQGMTVQQAREHTSQTAEGVASAEVVLALARTHGVDAPIAEHVTAVVRDGQSPRDMVRSIMSRATKPER